MPRRQRLRRGRELNTHAPFFGFYPSVTCRKTNLASLSSRRVARRDERQPSSTHKQKEARTQLAPGPRHHVGSLRESRAEGQGHAHLIFILLLGHVLPPGLYGAHEEPAASLDHGTTRTPRRHLGPRADNAERGDAVGPREAHFGEPSGARNDAPSAHDRHPLRSLPERTPAGYDPVSSASGDIDASARRAQRCVLAVLPREARETLPSATHGACARTLQAGALRHGAVLGMEAAVRGCRGEAGCAAARP